MAGVAVSSAATYKAVALSYADGSEQVVAISSDVVTTFEPEAVVFTDGYDRLEFGREGLSSFRFLTSYSPSGASVAGLKSTSNAVNFIYSGRQVQISNLPADARVQVCDMRGAIVFERTAKDECTIDTSSLPAGVYVVTCNDQTFKIAVGK